MSRIGHESKSSDKPPARLGFDKKKLGLYTINGINYLYLFLMLAVYPLVFRSRGEELSEKYYFNITKTRWDFFICVTVGYIILIVLAYIWEDLWSYHNKKRSDITRYDKGIVTPEHMMYLFMLANLFAYLTAVADDGLISAGDAFTGRDGRYMGLLTYIVIGFAFIMLARYAGIRMGIFVPFAAATCFAYVVAICQHVKPDLTRFDDEGYAPGGLKRLAELFPRFLYNLQHGMKKSQLNVFRSTFGNINIFAGFVVVSLAVFICMYIFTEDIRYKIVAGVIIVSGGMVMFISNSDSAYIGVGGVMFFMLLLSVKEGMLLAFMQSLILLGTGNLAITLINRYMRDELGKKYDKRGGFAELLDNYRLALILLVAAMVIYLIMLFIGRRYKDKLSGLNKNRINVIISVFTALALAAVVIIGHDRRMPAFTFNYRWGTFRGYIWTICIELYRDAPFISKLFGYGNESVRTLMSTYYYGDMIEVTGKIYDNAHNELLQYLLTTGLFGVLSYLGLCVTCFVYVLKNARGHAIAYMCLAAMLGYFIQSLISINQPITTPFMFLFMALGVGYVRYMKNEMN